MSEGLGQEEERKMNKKGLLSTLSLSLALCPSTAFKLRSTYTRVAFALSKTGQGELHQWLSQE